MHRETPGRGRANAGETPGQSRSLRQEKWRQWRGGATPGKGVREGWFRIGRFRTPARFIWADEVDQPNKFYYNPQGMFHAYSYY